MKTNVIEREVLVIHSVLLLEHVFVSKVYIYIIQ